MSTHTATHPTSKQEKLMSELVEHLISENASDLHFKAFYKPVIRVAGSLIPLTQYEELSPDDTYGMLTLMVSPEQLARFEADMELDFAYFHTVKKLRFRGNASIQQGSVSLTLRHIPNNIRSFDELGLPESLRQFADRQQGFFLMVGPVGQGKSTALAAMIEHINETRSEHIVTIEDPIEYLFTPKQCLIDQREVHLDTKSFHSALQGAFRQDVDVIMLGEMREYETISTAVTAAETGHLVLSTLHTNNAAQTIDRIIDSFPAHQQGQIRVQLSASLLAIFSIRLVPRIAGGLVPAYELLINNKAVANMIRERRSHEINSIIETSSEEGMISMNSSLLRLVRSGEITVEHALYTSTDPKDFERML